MNWEAYSIGHGMRIRCAAFLDKADALAFKAFYEIRYPSLKCEIKWVRE